MRFVNQSREYELQLYQGEHAKEFTVCELKDGKVEGRCQLYNRGIISLSWMMKNGKREGGITEYVKGKAVRRENWNSIFGRNDKRVIKNVKNKLIMTIQYKKSDSEKISDESFGNVIYQGEFDYEMNRNGRGIEFDINSGKELFEGIWEKDNLICVTREFDKDNNTMIEYSETSSQAIWQQIPMYIGGYCFEDGSIFRNGTGYLIDESSGAAIRESEWDHGIEIKGDDLYEGWYEKGIQDSIRNVINNLSQENMQTEDPSSFFAQNKIEVIRSEQLHEIDINITDLVVASNCGNHLSSLNLNSYSCLKSIEIGDNCFFSVKSFNLNGLKKLKRLKIGNCSFTQSKYCYKEDYSKSFHIVNCDKLESITIDEYSFSDCSGQFELRNLNSLKSIRIGSIGKHSNNFFFSSLVVRGRNADLLLIMYRPSTTSDS